MVFFAANVGLALLLSSMLARRLLPLDSLLGSGLVALVGVPIVVLPALTLLGICGCLRAPWIGGVLALAAVCLVCSSLRAPLRNSVSATRLPPEQQAGLLPQRRLSVLTAMIIAVTVVLAGRLAKAQLLAGWTPISDDLSYHATMAAHWIAAGEFVLAPYDYHAYFPANAELFALWLVLPTHLDAYAGLAGLYWAVVCAVGLAYFCVQARVDRVVATLAVAMLFGCGPLVRQAGSFAAVELAASALMTAAMALAISREASLRPRAQALYCGALCGLAVGCKVSYAPIGALLLCSLVRDQIKTRPDEDRQSAHRGRPAIGICALFLLSSMLCGGYWYVRNWLLTGNPVFPAELLLFDGPLDAATQRQTSLFFQLQQLDAKAVAHSLGRLLDWPTGLMALSLSGYALAAASFLSRNGRRDEVAGARTLAFLAGTAALVVFALGPFSGTADSASVLRIRPRFFMLFMVQGIALWAIVVARSRRFRFWLLSLSTVVVVASSELRIWLTCAALAGGAIALLFNRHPLRVLPTHRPRWLGIVAFVVAVPSIGAAMSARQTVTDRNVRKVGKDWADVGELPDGARVGWFASHVSERYYAAFGRRLQIVPVAMEADGDRYHFLHEDWRTFRPTFLQPRERPKHMDQLIANLRARNVTHVRIKRSSDGAWGEQYAILRAFAGAAVVEKSKTLALFRLDFGG